MKVRVASAGTGKTTSLVLRYLELIGCGTPLRRVAGVTFTRAAADELRQRVGGGLRELLEKGEYLDYALHERSRPAFEEARLELDGATLTTIHGFMSHALRLVAPTMGLDPDFGGLGEWEARATFEEEWRSLRYLASSAEHGLHAACALLGSEADDLLLTLFGARSLTERFSPGDHPTHQALQTLFEAVYKRYEIRLGASLLPPSEIERRALKLVRNPKALERLALRYHTVLVDEFQDVNPLQGEFFERLEGGGLNIEVVGDPKQSIYGFRNADVGVFRRALEGALASDSVLPPLDQTRRHARVITRFLNHMTGTFAAGGLGFGPLEAPEVSTVGTQTDVQGRVELHWMVGDAPVGDLRAAEAAVLSSRLKALHERGHAYGEMAVLARSYAGLNVIETALLTAGLPYVLVQGRGYFERLEVRDLYHALHVGIDASGLSLAAWLRSPFAGLDLADVDRLLLSENPVERLEADFPEVFGRLERIRQQVRGTPLDALKFLVRAPFVGGKRYVDFLDARARENVDALLFTVAQGPPGEIEILLDRLELLSRQADAGDVPQSGEGISLLTVHRAKGLEWPVVAVFDMGRGSRAQTQTIYVKHDGAIHCQESGGFEEARKLVKAREEGESYRLLYVAASRARDVLVMTGSVKGNKADGWADALCAMNLGPDTKSYTRPDFVLQTHSHHPTRFAPPPVKLEPTPIAPAPYIDRHFPRHTHPPVTSPSALKSSLNSDIHPVSHAGFGTLEAHEPLPFSDPDEGERLPGRATTVGTLVHYAISQNWSARNAQHVENLRAQEVMFPFLPGEQESILDEVRTLLGSYESLLGEALPALEDRTEDHAELPMALPQDATVWQGVIDRLYCAGGVWVLEDYKTDYVIAPERYYFQLAVYLKAVQEVRGVTPRVRLVYLREGEVLELTHETLLEAFAGARAQLSKSNGRA